MGRRRESKGRKEAEGQKRVGKGEGGLDLDICPQTFEFLLRHCAALWDCHQV